MKRILFVKILLSVLFFSTATFAERTCPDGQFDLEFTHIGPEIVQSGENLHITVEATNIPDKVFRRGVERVEWRYRIFGYRKLEEPETGTIGNCKKNCIGYLRTHEEVLIMDETRESTTFTAVKSSALQLPEIPIDYENKVWIRVYMNIYYKANFFDKFLSGCDINYAYSDVDTERAVCHTPSITYNVDGAASIADHIPQFQIIRLRNAIARGIPLGETETTLSPRLGGLDIGGLELTWETDHSDWTLSSYTGGVDENVTLYTDGYTSHGEVTVTIDATECSSGPKPFDGVPIVRYVPRPDVVTAPSGICEQTESTIEIEGHPYAIGYVWELVQGPVTLDGQNVQTLTTTEPRLNISTSAHGYTHIRVRYQTNIDYLVENNNLYMMYDVEYDPRNAIRAQFISALRWRNFEFWSGGSGPATPITQTNYFIENCKGPVTTYSINQPEGADRYEWEFISTQTPAPSYLNDIVHVEENQFSVDGYIRMNDGETVQFIARVKVYGVNNCTPEIEEKLIRYRYFTNDPDGTCQGIFGDGLLGGRAGKSSEEEINSEVLDETSDISVFPNPTSDILQLKIPTGATYSVSIYNTSEQLVFQDRAVKREMRLNVSQYPKGLYIMNVHNSSGKRISATKVIIEH